MDIIDKIIELSNALEPHELSIRRTIHQNPELSFKEFETSRLVCSELARMDIPYEKSEVEPGIVATIDSGKAGKLLLLRADMDALPINEATGTEYSSKNKDVMHACGHDIHTANLLTVAEILKSTVNGWRGKVKLVFQPAEENGGGGRKMIEAGLLENPAPNACMAMHVFPHAKGLFTIADENVTAYSDGMGIIVHGKSAHSSAPQDGVDAINIAAHILVALNSISSKSLSPLCSATLNVGIIRAGTAANVIADKAEMACMLRSLTSDARKTIITKVQDMAKGISEAMGGSADVILKEGYVSVYNNKELSAFASKVIETNAKKLYADINSGDIPSPYLKTGACPGLIAEDFGFYSQKVPSCFIMVGVGEGAPTHSPEFCPDEAYIKLCTRAMALLAVSYLNEE
ncbi:MAG: M20 family metallopeptidase [Oscillospiraceae bacterium]